LLYLRLMGLIIYHGTQEEYAYSLIIEGFRLHNVIWGRGAGNGVYASRSKSFAADWGELVVFCELSDSARILKYDMYDSKVIASLKREFGADILTSQFWKVLPHNKQFKKQEVIELWRYIMKNEYLSYSKKNKNYYTLLTRNLSYLYKQLHYHQFDGFDITLNDWPEMMIFNPDLIRPLSVHRVEMRKQYRYSLHDYTDSENTTPLFSKALSMNELKVLQEEALKELEEYSQNYDE